MCRLSRSPARPGRGRGGRGHAQRAALRDRGGGRAGRQARPVREADGDECGECDRMLAAIEQAGVKLQIGFMRRFDAGFVAAKQRVDAGEIGRVVSVKSLTHGPTIPKPWMYDIRKSNGPLSEVNSHDIDTVRWFSGSEFDEVYAIAGNYRSPDAREQYPDFYDNVILSARLRERHAGLRFAEPRGCMYGYDARCEILGEKGLITVGSLAANTVTTTRRAAARVRLCAAGSNLFLDAYRAEDEDFVRCVREDRQPRAGGQDGKAAVMVVNAGNRSIAQRRPVLLERGRSLSSMTGARPMLAATYTQGGELSRSRRLPGRRSRATRFSCGFAPRRFAAPM